MKRRFIMLIITILFVSLQTAFSQKMLQSSGNLSSAGSRLNTFRLFKSAGVKIGHSTNEYGWNHPFPVITQNYHEPGIGTVKVGAYFEGLSSRYYSTVIEAAYHGRDMKFDYDLYDGNGNIIGTNTSQYEYRITSFSIAEKVKFSMLSGGHELELYGFGGLKLDMITSSKFDRQQESYLSGYKNSIPGFITGIGFSVGKSFRFSADFYYSEDLKDIYETPDGNYKNKEFGIVVGLGYNNFK